MIQHLLWELWCPHYPTLQLIAFYLLVYCSLDGYPASLGFPVMHRVHAMAYAPNLKGRFVNGWFVNILPPLKFPSLPCSHAPSLSRSIPPPLTSSLPSFPRAVLSSLVPFINPPLNPPFLHWRSLPPSLPPYLPPSLPPSALTTRPPRPPHPTQCRPTLCVCGVGELRWVGPIV